MDLGEQQCRNYGFRNIKNTAINHQLKYIQWKYIQGYLNKAFKFKSTFKNVWGSVETILATTQNVTASNRASWPPHLTKDYGDKEVVDEECLRGMAVIVLEEERSKDDDEILDRRVTERATHHLDTADDDEERGNAGTWSQTSRLYTHAYILVVLHNSPVFCLGCFCRARRPALLWWRLALFQKLKWCPSLFWWRPALFQKLYFVLVVVHTQRWLCPFFFRSLCPFENLGCSLAIGFLA